MKTSCIHGRDPGKLSNPSNGPSHHLKYLKTRMMPVKEEYQDNLSKQRYGYYADLGPMLCLNKSFQGKNDIFTNGDFPYKCKCLTKGQLLVSLQGFS